MIVDDNVVCNPLAVYMSRVQTAATALRSDTARPVSYVTDNFYSPANGRYKLINKKQTKKERNIVTKTLSPFTSFKIATFGNHKCKNKYEQYGKALKVHLQLVSARSVP